MRVATYGYTERGGDNMLSITKDTLPAAYHAALDALFWHGDIVDCPDWNTECLETDISFTVLHPLREPMISRCFPGGPRELEQYKMEIIDGILDFEIYRGRWSYTYHERIGFQLHEVIKELTRNPLSRRAVIQVRRLADVWESDPPCLQQIQLMIRDGKLNMHVLFRSNDAIKAAFMNAFALIMLQKKIADQLGVDVGTYTHTANSFHAYKKDFPTLKGILHRIAINKDNGDKDDLTYSYAGEWQELMEEERPSILAAVQKLKEYKPK